MGIVEDKINIGNIQKPDITLEFLEKRYGYPINCFKIEEVFHKGRHSMYNVFIEPKRAVEYIEMNLTINKTGDVEISE